MKKIFFTFAQMLILSIVTTGTMVIGIMATSVATGTVTTAFANPQTPYIIDNASLLTDSQVKALEEKSAEIRKNYNFDVVILTESSIGNRSPQSYSSNFFHTNVYNEDGIIFLISMAERDWDISTFGDAREVITDSYGVGYITDKIVPSLSDGEYNKSFKKLLNYVDMFLLEAKSGTPYSVDNKIVPKNEIMLVILVGALVVSGLILFGMISTMNTKRPENFAHEYTNKENINMTENTDMFLYTSVTKVARPKKSSSSGGGGGGSRVGGASGKF